MAGGRLMMRLARRADRRKVVGSAVGIAVSAVAGTFHAAVAGRGWCRSDPLITIDGYLSDIFVTAPLEALLYVDGPTEIVVTVPRGVKAALVLAGIGFGRGERVSFAQSRKLEQIQAGIEVKIAVKVPAKKALSIGIEFAPRLLDILNPIRADGTTNEWITMTSRI
jgi:hypothetical protein